MKKLAVTLILVALGISLFAVVASAQDPGVEETVFAYEGDASNARVWRLNEGWETICNVTPRTEEITVKAHVAQWARWEANFEGWEWYVKKPGDYYANCIEGQVQSNGQVTIRFIGFNNLVAEEGTNIVEGATGEIETFYAALVGSGEPSIDQWTAAESLSSITLEDSMRLHSGDSWKLWNRIIVVDCNSPGVYSNYPTLELTLDNQVDWIDGDTGDFISPPAPPAPAS